MRLDVFVEGKASCRHAMRCMPVAEVTSAGSSKRRLAVFVSGGGSNFRCIHEACLRGDVHGEVVVVVSNRADCGGVLYANKHQIPIIIFPAEGPAAGLSAEELAAELQKAEVEFVLLAGYLKLVPSEVVQAFPRRMLNIHPALLPAFGGKGYYGMRVHKAVVASGVRFSGPTVHFVDEEFDRGPILAQRIVPVNPVESPEIVASNVLHEEHKLYPACVAALCSNRITWREDGVPIIWSPQ